VCVSFFIFYINIFLFDISFYSLLYPITPIVKKKQKNGGGGERGKKGKGERKGKGG
jgi:hypothetical protein